MQLTTESEKASSIG